MKSLNPILKFFPISAARLVTGSMGIAAIGGALFSISFLEMDFQSIYNISYLLALGGLMIYLYITFRKEWYLYSFGRFWAAVLICPVTMFFILCATSYWVSTPDAVLLQAPVWLGGHDCCVSEHIKYAAGAVFLSSIDGAMVWSNAVFSWPSLVLFSAMIIPVVLKGKQHTKSKSIQSSCVYNSGEGAEEKAFGPGPESSLEDINNCG